MTYFLWPLTAVLLVLLLTTAATAGPDAATTFAAIGDFGDGSQAEADVATLVDSWSPDLVITVGDNDYGAGTLASLDDNVGQFYAHYIHPYTGAYGPGATSNAFWPALGNHDFDAISCTGSSCSGPHFDYFTLPNNERYYDFVVGDIHFFVISSDPREPDGTASTSTQAIWLQSALAGTTSPWKIVYFHHAPYASAGSNDTYMRWPFEAWGASLVMYGHHHFYERLEVDGIPYFVNGLGGRSIVPVGTPIPESIVRYDGDYGAMRGVVTPFEMTLEFINRGGTTIDTITLQIPPTAVSHLPIIAKPPAPIAAPTVAFLLVATLVALGYRSTTRRP